MSKLKLFMSLVLAISILFVQVGGVFAASNTQAFPPIKGTIQSITLETDPTTGVTTIVITVVDSNQEWQVVRVNQETAMKRLKLIGLDADGKPVINKLALGGPVEIELTMVIPNKEETEHPVASALANFFSDHLELDYDNLYDMIMTAHNGDFAADEGFESGKGFGFGVIAQALWMTKELNSESSADTFKALLLAKQTGDYRAFTLTEDGTVPQNWGQLRKAVLEGKKVHNPGLAMSNKDDNEKGNQDKTKEKKDKRDNGKDTGNDPQKDKEKNK